MQLSEQVMEAVQRWEADECYTEREWLYEVLDTTEEEIDTAIESLVGEGRLVPNDIFVTTPAIAEHGSFEQAREAGAIQ